MFCPFSRFFLIAIIILPLSLTSTNTVAVLSNDTDRLALLEFKSRITDDPFGALTWWNNSIHFCQWNGVTCGQKNQRVTILNLESQKLFGSISPFVGNLSFLMKLYLSNNSFKNQIPPELGHLRRLKSLDLGNNSLVGEIPENLSSCHNLEAANFDANQLTGKIPMSLGSLPKLWGLSAQFNYLVGAMPSSFGNLSSLLYLDLTRNYLSGEIPNTLGQLKTLISMGIGDNVFTGIIPPSMLNLSSVEGFDFGSNQLHGTLPSNLFITCPLLSFFSVAGNQFSGSIPISLSNASNMDTFYLSSNNFSGKVPNLEKLHNLQRFGIGNNSLGFGVEGDLLFLSSLVNATDLQEIQVSLNNFGGVLPESISNLSRSLREMVMEDNQFVGTIPAGIGNLRNLESLSMTGNHLSGTIPEQIGNLQNLKVLYINENKLTGNIPSSIGNLVQLLYLQLRRNKLQGTIPSTLVNCTNLLELGLSGNLFYGIIPLQLFNISNLVLGLDLSDNLLSGPLPVEVGNLKNLHLLDVSRNRLSGEIPSSLGGCTSLEFLNMQENLFYGAIPSSLSSLKGMQSLDLSHNNLSGGIPTFLQDFVFLENLNLSFNNFVGMVPEGGAFKNASATSIQGNNELCGGIPEFHLPMCISNEPKKLKRFHKLKIVLSIVLTFAVAVAMAMTSLVFFLLRKKRNKRARSSSLLHSLLQVSYRTLYKSTDGFSASNLIGMGSFGCVYKATLDQDRIVAVKVFNLQRRGAFKSFMVECDAMKNIRHRNLVKVITACSSIDINGDDFKALVYEFMVNGSLDEWLHNTTESNDPQNVRKKMNLIRRLNIAIDVASALDYLHNQYDQTPIVHCDLKPSNVLLDDEMVAQVGDFGLVKFLEEETSISTSMSSTGIRGTVGYAAPEYGMGSAVSTQGDMYSYGILLLEMFSGKRPTDDMFSNSLNLHSYVKMALPGQVAEVAEPVLLEDGTQRNGKILESLVMIFEIGVACSEEVSRERMEIRDALAKLIVIQNNLIGEGVRGRGRQVLGAEFATGQDQQVPIRSTDLDV